MQSVAATDEKRPIDKLADPLRRFARREISGALLLIGAAVLAVVLANSPLAKYYDQLRNVPLSVSFGQLRVDKPLWLWINDGLMGVFFFHVGLELKREVQRGELASLRRALLPAVAAVGGMLVPAALYAAVNLGKSGEAGWGIPMATDIAFALGVLALLGDRVPGALRVFLAGLAIVDDIGAVLVIAVFYTDHVSLVSLGFAAACYASAWCLNALGVRSVIAYMVVGLACWLAFLESGVHATIAALLMAFAIPGTTRIDGSALLRRVRDSSDDLRQVGVPCDGSMNTARQQRVLDTMAEQIQRASSPSVVLEWALAPFVAFVVLPLFALANAAVDLSFEGLDDSERAIAFGVALGLCVGKQVGITSFAWLAVRLRIAELPEGVRWRGIHAIGVMAGIGFTMSLFISGLAFEDGPHAAAKLGILGASLVCGVSSWLLLRSALPSAAELQHADR